MADYCRIAVTAKPRDLWVNKFLSELEDNFSDQEDDDVSNLIAVSFIEHLPPPNEAHSITSQLEGKVKQQYDITFRQISPFA